MNKIIAYHGTDKLIKKFDSGSFFVSDKSKANEYGKNIYTVQITYESIEELYGQVDSMDYHIFVNLDIDSQNEFPVDVISFDGKLSEDDIYDYTCYYVFSENNISIIEGIKETFHTKYEDFISIK